MQQRIKKQLITYAYALQPPDKGTSTRSTPDTPDTLDLLASAGSYEPFDTLRTTWYIRDATGNVLAVYEQVKDTITWTEQHLYGSSRLGMVQPQIVWKPEESPEPGIPYFKQNKNQVYGARRYEITNHLGNVAAVISDRKMPFVHQTNVFFDAVVHSAADYFPFGSLMTGRTFQAGGYKYRFNPNSIIFKN